MKIHRFDSKDEMGAAAASLGAAAIPKNEDAAILVATGSSQFATLSHLAKGDHGIDWRRITGFHLDEYVGMPDSHPASFRRYLRERFVEVLPSPMKAFHYLDAEQNPEIECRRVGELFRNSEISVAFVGIGENGHLAFNDPPADFETEEPFELVDLDIPCREQQVREGWFETLSEVPARAITITIRQIMESKVIICSVSEERKAEAVRNAVNGPVTPEVPASILQLHPACHLFLDSGAASLLDDQARSVSLVES